VNNISDKTNVNSNSAFILSNVNLNSDSNFNENSNLLSNRPNLITEINKGKIETNFSPKILLKINENKKNNKLILKKKKISLKNNFEESAIALNIIKNSKNEISPNDKISNNIDLSLNNEKKEKISTNESGKENYNEGDFKKQNSFKLEEKYNNNNYIENLTNKSHIDINEIKVNFKKEE